MTSNERFSSWDDDSQETPITEDSNTSEKSTVEEIFSKVVEADKNRPATVYCEKEFWPEVKKMMNEAKIRSRYNHNTIKLK